MIVYALNNNKLIHVKNATSGSKYKCISCGCKLCIINNKFFRHLKKTKNICFGPIVIYKNKN